MTDFVLKVDGRIEVQYISYLLQLFIYQGAYTTSLRMNTSERNLPAEIASVA